jgi:sugar lactone lactonase YvrE
MGVFFAVLAAVLVLTSAQAQAGWTNGQAATVVLGQSTFTTSTQATTQNGMSGPTSVCVDKTTGKVFVADYRNHRVLRFTSADAAVNGSNAEAVFGQDDFTTNTNGRTQAKLFYPMACAITDAGDLWISDSYNGRVLLYQGAASKPTTGAAADKVLGQADYTSYSSTVDQATLYSQVYGVAVTADGSTLWASCTNQNRVLRWDNPASKNNGAAADGVLGQATFTTNASGTTATTLNYPLGLALDASGNLFVSDQNNSRVLRFDSAAAKGNGAAADGVLGAADFITAGSAAVTASTFSVAYGLSIASDGKLYLSSLTQNRVLIFNSPASKANGADADNVLGQTTFTTNALATSATGLCGPLGLGFNPLTGLFYVGDYSNNRIVGYYNSEIGGSSPVPSQTPWQLALFAGLFLILGLGLALQSSRR